MLEKRLVDLAKHMGFDTVDAMYRQTKLNMPDEMKLMLTDLSTNNETLFFRDPNMFQALEKLIVENGAIYKNCHVPIQIWSAACSFGQEPYSLAMLFEKISSHITSRGYSILATDISRKALEAAKKGVYTQLQVQRGLPTRLLIKNFDKISKDETHYEWAVKPSLKSRIRFEHKNLLDENYGPVQYDFIFCRNVLIYQSKEMKEVIINRLFDCLKVGGYLILGAPESLLGLKHSYELVSGENHVFFRKPESSPKLEAV
ncbi:MAG: protein-glutamate O-methyltransferase CheR [Bdellovibrionota bacterium]